MVKMLLFQKAIAVEEDSRSIAQSINLDSMGTADSFPLFPPFRSSTTPALRMADTPLLPLSTGAWRMLVDAAVQPGEGEDSELFFPAGGGVCLVMGGRCWSISVYYG